MDDVSALTLDFGSVLAPQHDVLDAGDALMSRLRREVSSSRKSIPEADECIAGPDENDGRRGSDENDGGGRSCPYSKHGRRRSQNSHTSDGDKLKDDHGQHEYATTQMASKPTTIIEGIEKIVEMPKTFEEWQKKRDKKDKKHKSKKHHKRDKKEKKKHGSDYYERRLDNPGGEDAGAAHFPIKEVCIDSERSSQHDIISDMRMCPSVTSTTAESSNYNDPDHFNSSTNLIQSGNISCGNFNNSGNLSNYNESGHFNSSTNLNQSGNLSCGNFNNSGNLSSSSRVSRGAAGVTNPRASMISQDTFGTHPTHGTHHTPHTNATHDTSASSACHSHITFEDIHQLRMELDQAKLEETKVSKIHRRLEEEVQSAMEESQYFKEYQRNIDLELRAATMERERLKSYLEKVENENAKLKSSLTKLEERVEDKKLDDMIDNMEAKMLSMRSRLHKKSKGQGKKTAKGQEQKICA